MAGISENGNVSKRRTWAARQTESGADGPARCAHRQRLGYFIAASYISAT